MEEFVKQLRDAVVEDLLQDEESSDKEYVWSGTAKRTLTKRELSEEVKNGTKEGDLMLTRLIKLSMDLFNRGKEDLKDVRLIVGSTPEFEHDCESCVFLGHYNKNDLYCCEQGSEGSGRWTVIARRSSSGPDYSSGIVFATPDGNEWLYKAKLLAIEKGLIDE